ncbi:metallophosphoesterase [Alicyclobacillus sp. SO9]|uniref:metallophosphoesterase n=1 Tax=Alicyclobacillus sp. SO9 TaxID=2665646 RepID=UPI0018E8231C|nr:metallophosphoesterase [Alicyclobacillus sp. SO9]QQE76840.1 metallophosphoesterase [Alicyclobacillus sp. SO9]
MPIYALGDLHLSLFVDKPMDIFGQTWEHHTEQIEANWRTVVNNNDTVLLPGDLSWGMTLDEAVPDLEWMARLPGHQIMIRGNHDYWWHGITRLRQTLATNQTAIQNDAVVAEGYAICGTRGWLLPSHPQFDVNDEPIFRRELERLRLSLTAASKLDMPIIAMLHYPPCSSNNHQTEFTEILESYNVKVCIYGHLHGPTHRFAFEGEQNGVTYRLVSADFVNFSPIRLNP